MDDRGKPNFMQCGICHKICEEPRILNCLHTFCLSCLNSQLIHEMNEGRKLTCHTCAAQVNIEGSCQSLKENMLFSHIADLIEVDSEEISKYDAAEVEYIVNLAQNKKSEMQVKMNRIERKYEDTCKGLTEKKRQLTDVQLRTNNKISTFFCDLRNKVNEYLTQKEKGLQDEVNQELEKEHEINQLEQKWLDTMKNLLSEISDFLNNLSVTSGSKAGVAMEVFEEMDAHFGTFDRKFSKINIDEFDVEFSSIDEEVRKLFEVEPTKLEAKNTSVYRIGENDTTSQDEEVNIDTLEPSAPEISTDVESFVSVRAMYVRTFRSNNPGERDGYISGISWLDNQHLVIIDRSNHSIKLCTERGDIIATRSFLGNATDVVKTKMKYNEQTFVMTLPEKRLLMQFAVKGSRNLYIKSQIHTEIGYVCLAYDEDYSKLVCCVTLPFGHPRIDVVNGNGSVYKTFVWSQLLEDPRSIVISEDGVMVVLDQKRKCLLFISTDGRFLGLYKGTSREPLRDPGSLCLDRNLNIYVTDSESHAIDIVRLDRTRMCRVESDVELGMLREIDLLNQSSPRLAVHDTSYGNGYISIYEVSVPAAIAQQVPVDRGLFRQTSSASMGSDAPPLYSPASPTVLPNAPPLPEDENPPSYESIFGTSI